MICPNTVCIGAIADRIPTHRMPFVLALLLASSSTVCFALGVTLPVLLSARILEGLSAAVVATVGSALMREVVGQEHFGRAAGFSSMALSMGLILGPVIGGVLYEYAGYFETFLPVLVLLGVELVLRLLIIEDGTRGVATNGEDKGPGGEGRNDGAEDGAKGTAGTEADVGATGTGECSPSAVESQPLLPNPPASSTRTPTGNVYLALLANSRFLVSITGVFILNSIASGFDAVLAPYISSTFSLGPVHVAALFLTLAIPMLFSPLTGALTDRFGAKIVASTGLGIGVPSLMALGLVRPGTVAPMLMLGGLFFSIGVALALSLVPLQVDATAAVGAMEEKWPGAFGPRGAYARAFGLMNGMVAAGGLVGPLAAGYVRIRMGWDGMALVMSGLTFLVFGSVVVWTGGRKL